MERVLEAGKLVLASLRARLLGDVVTTEGTHECMYLEWVRVILAGHDFPPDVLFLRAVRSCAYACLSFEEASVLLCTRRLAMWVRLRQFQCGGPGQEAVAAFAAFGAQRAKAAVRLSDTQTQLSKQGPPEGARKTLFVLIPAVSPSRRRPSPGLHKQQCVEWPSPQPRRTPTLFGVASLHRLPSSQIRCSSMWHRFADQQQSLRTSLHEPPRATLLHGRTAGPRTGQARQAQNRAAGCGGRQKAESRSAACARSSSTITAPLYCPTHSGNVHYVSTYRYKT